MRWLRAWFSKNKSADTVIKSYLDNKAVFTDFTVLLSLYFNTYKTPMSRFDIAHLFHLKDHLGAFGNIYVAYVDDEPVGCVVLEAMSPRKTRPYGSELSRLFVLPEYRGQGIATALIKRCAQTLQDWNELYCFLVVNEKDSVVKMYKELGFVPSLEAQEAGSEGVCYLEANVRKLTS